MQSSQEYIPHVSVIEHSDDDFQEIPEATEQKNRFEKLNNRAVVATAPAQQ